MDGNTEKKDQTTVNKWWRIEMWGNTARFIPIVFARETKEYLVKEDGRRESKLNGYGRWFPTQAEALADAIASKERQVESQRKILADAEERLEALKKVEPQL